MTGQLTRRGLLLGGAGALAALAGSGCRGGEPAPGAARRAGSPIHRPAPPGAFRSSFETGTLSEWTSWRRADAGRMYVATAAAEGIEPRDGAHVARFEVSDSHARAGRVHSKLYKIWALAPPARGSRDDSGLPYQRLPASGPDGFYSAWFRLPDDYRPDDEWVNLLQFKEGYLDDPEDPGSWRQDPQWWVALAPAGQWDPDRRPSGLAADDPVLVTANWAGAEDRAAPLAAAPRGRWFEIRAGLRSAERIDWYLDRRLWHSSSAALYPVGISKRTPIEWVFGVGHYGGRGHLWVDAAGFEPRAR